MTSSEQYNVNSLGTLIAAIAISLVGVEVFIIQPGFVQGLVEYGGYSEVRAGVVSSVEMWGIAAATIVFSLSSQRLNWRYCIFLAVLLMWAGNWFSSWDLSYNQFLAMRCLAGFGSGILISLGFVIIGLSAKADRNFALMILCLLLYASVAFYLLPQAYRSLQLAGVLQLFAWMSLAALPAAWWLPSHSPASVACGTGAAKPSAMSWAAITTVFIYFLGQGVIWSYLFLMGVDAGLSEAIVANGLSVAQFAGVGGALVAVVAAGRLGRSKPLALGMLLSVVSLAMILPHSYPAWLYLVSVSIFNFAWNMTHPYLMAVLADLDNSGKLVAIGVAAQMLGLAVGPAVAAIMLQANGYSLVVGLGMGLFSLAGLLIVASLFRFRSSFQKVV